MQSWSTDAAVWPLLAAAALLLAVGMVGAVIVAATSVMDDGIQEAEFVREKPIVERLPPRLEYEYRTTADLIEAVEQAVVQIDTNIGQSSGFVIDPAGLIVTCHHCIDGAVAGKVVFADKEQLRIVGVRASMPDRDLVVLEVSPHSPLPGLKLVDSPPRKGDPLVVFGSPAGFSFTTSEGSVSALRTDSEVPKRAGANIDKFTVAFASDAELVQYSAPTVPGNSGGPLVNYRGRVIGVVSYGITSHDRKFSFAVSYAEIARLPEHYFEKAVPLYDLARVGSQPHTHAD